MISCTLVNVSRLVIQWMDLVWMDLGQIRAYIISVLLTKISVRHLHMRFVSNIAKTSNMPVLDMALHVAVLKACLKTILGRIANAIGFVRVIKRALTNAEALQDGAFIALKSHSHSLVNVYRMTLTLAVLS